MRKDFYLPKDLYRETLSPHTVTLSHTCNLDGYSRNTGGHYLDKHGQELEANKQDYAKALSIIEEKLEAEEVR